MEAVWRAVIRRQREEMIEGGGGQEIRKRVSGDHHEWTLARRGEKVRP